MTFKKILALSIIASAAGLAKPAVGQSIKLHSVANHIYVQHNGEWYTFANGERADRVDLDHLIVRVQESASIHQVNFAQAGLPALKDIRGRFGNGFYELEVPRNADAFQLAHRLEQSGLFEEIMFNVYYEIDSIPNDAFYPQQWNLTKISMPNAWDISTGSSDIIVAIIDVGGEHDHPDLIGNRWENTLEVNGSPGVDDDGNGYVDDFYGWDFDNNDNTAEPENLDAHGTEVAGIIGASRNNNTGVAGIAGGSNGLNGVRLMHLDAGHSTSIGLSAATDAIDYAIQMGADVINMSFGGYSVFVPFQSAISNAANNHDIVLVGAAGNEARSPVIYPAAYNEVIAVGATDENDARRSFSNFGPGLDVVAPSQVPTTTLSTLGYYNTTFSGTSAAAPHVAGLAALIRAMKPSYSWQDVRYFIRGYADKVYGMNGQNRTNFYGYGRINAYNTLNETPPSASISGPICVETTTSYTWTADVSGGISPYLYEWYKSCDSGVSNQREGDTNHFGPSCDSGWEIVDFDLSYTYTPPVGEPDFTLRFDVTDDNDVVKSAYIWVTVQDYSCGSGFMRLEYTATKLQATAEKPFVPTEYSLYENYPNPFNPTTEIRFALPESAPVSLVIYDVTGREVARLVDGTLAAGYHRVQWEASAMPSGLYLYRLTAGTYTETRRMILMK